MSTLSYWNVAHAEVPAAMKASNDEKFFRLSEIQRHGKHAERRWVIRGDRVYDVEDWIPNHPGE